MLNDIIKAGRNSGTPRKLPASIGSVGEMVGPLAVRSPDMWLPALAEAAKPRKPSAPVVKCCDGCALLPGQSRHQPTVQ